MDSTELGYDYDISFDPVTEEDVIIIDLGDSAIHLTLDDLRKMIKHLVEWE